MWYTYTQWNATKPTKKEQILTVATKWMWWNKTRLSKTITIFPLTCKEYKNCVNVITWDSHTKSFTESYR